MISTKFPQGKRLHCVHSDEYSKQELNSGAVFTDYENVRTRQNSWSQYFQFVYILRVIAIKGLIKILTRYPITLRTGNRSIKNGNIMLG